MYTHILQVVLNVQHYNKYSTYDLLAVPGNGTPFGVLLLAVENINTMTNINRSINETKKTLCTYTCTHSALTHKHTNLFFLLRCWPTAKIFINMD